MARLWERQQGVLRECCAFLGEEFEGPFSIPADEVGENSVDGSTRSRLGEAREKVAGGEAEVAELLAEGFNKSGSTSRDLLNGLVQKVRRRALSFPSLTLRLPLPLTSFRSIVNRCGGAAVTSCAS